MELPIVLAMDTTEGWDKSDTALFQGELAIEIYTEADGTQTKRLLIGDDNPVGEGGVSRLRVTPNMPQYDRGSSRHVRCHPATSEGLR